MLFTVPRLVYTLIDMIVDLSCVVNFCSFYHWFVVSIYPPLVHKFETVKVQFHDSEILREKLFIRIYKVAH